MESSSSTPATASDHPTHVVTCFLLRRDRGKDEVLLARRSDKVRTYPGHWAAISGYVESGVAPLDQAYQEIREETSLPKEDVALLQHGEALAFQDESVGVDWVVHPFLFLVMHPDAVVHDWEALEFAWRPPEDISTLLTVPHLADALMRVYSLPGETSL